MTRSALARPPTPVLALAHERAAYLRTVYGEDVDLMAADRRFGFVSGVTRQVVSAARSTAST